MEGVRVRRVPPPGLGPLLGAARMRRGWRLREAARLLGVSAGYLCDLEAGRRCPSAAVAHVLADGYGMPDPERAELFRSVVGDAGRDHPARRSA